jgi:uncharacterized lipoprotein
MSGSDFNTAWDAAIDVFAERLWPIYSLERASGLITTDWMTAHRSEMDCGEAGLTNTHRDHEVRMSVVIREADSGSSLTVHTAARSARWDVINGSFRGMVDCVSTGLIEREVHDDVRRRAR